MEPGKVAIPVWSVQDIRPNESFEVVILNKMKEPIDKPPVKRRKVHMKTKVLSDPEYVAELKRLAEKDEEKKQKQKKERIN